MFLIYTIYTSCTIDIVMFNFLSLKKFLSLKMVHISPLWAQNVMKLMGNCLPGFV